MSDTMRTGPFPELYILYETEVSGDGFDRRMTYICKICQASFTPAPDELGELGRTLWGHQMLYHTREQRCKVTGVPA